MIWRHSVVSAAGSAAGFVAAAAAGVGARDRRGDVPGDVPGDDAIPRWHEKGCQREGAGTVRPEAHGRIPTRVGVNNGRVVMMTRAGTPTLRDCENAPRWHPIAWPGIAPPPPPPPSNRRATESIATSPP